MKKARGCSTRRASLERIGVGHAAVIVDWQVGKPLVDVVHRRRAKTGCTDSLGHLAHDRQLRLERAARGELSGRVTSRGHQARSRAGADSAGVARLRLGQRSRRSWQRTGSRCAVEGRGHARCAESAPGQSAADDRRAEPPARSRRHPALRSSGSWPTVSFLHARSPDWSRAYSFFVRVL